MYWSACGEDLSPAGATGVERSARVEEGKSRTLGGELQMSLELGFGAMRVVLQILTKDVFMDMRALRTKYRWMIYRSCVNKCAKVYTSLYVPYMNANPNSNPTLVIET